MCLECGFYNGKQIMDIEAEKTKRNARIQAKKERISAEAKVATPESSRETVEEISTKDTSKEAKEKNRVDKKPERRPEKRPK